MISTNKLIFQYYLTYKEQTPTLHFLTLYEYVRSPKTTNLSSLEIVMD